MKLRISVVLLFFISAVLVPQILIAETEQSPSQSAQKAILVTGASSGIGLKITEYLAADGHFVYAGARKEKDLEALNEIPNVQSIRLDVTIQADIDAAVASITAAGRGLYGVVNNAGVAIVGPMLDVTEDDFHFQMNVNVYGPVRITRAFGPLVVAEKGRFTTIGSIAGTLSPAELGAYSMTKHAMEAFTDALAAEMAPLGVIANIVEPGNYKSRISASAFARMAGNAEKPGAEVTANIKQRLERGPDDRSRFKDPDEVAAAVMLALFDENPKHRYMVVPNQDEAAYTIGQAVRELVQLNADQTYSYDREALIEMIDREMGMAVAEK